MATMSEVLALLLPLALGTVLGATFFAGLWWTVVRGVSSRWVALWFIGSLLLRTGIAVAGFYLVARGHWLIGGGAANAWAASAAWKRLLACLAGFLLARFIVTCYTRRAVLPAPLAKASHAS